MTRLGFKVLIILLGSAFTAAAQQKQLNAAEIQLALAKLNTTGSVLYIAAHPDDENTRLLTYLANERKLRTGYLSMTRGDGGQNLIGTEQGELLGLIRTQELLAARRTDGAEQFFTRANDFGFSKNPEETFRIWNKEEILSDVVWVIRNFQPDLIITRFPTDGSGGHGHHTASAILAEEAFDAAADPDRFPEQLKYVKPWKTKRMVWNGFNFQGLAQSDGKDFVKMDIGAYNVLLGKNYGEIASESRSMHKSQGFGVPMQRGGMNESFRYVKGDSLKQSIFEGMNFGWSKVTGGKKVEALILKAQKAYTPAQPSAIIPILLQVYDACDQLADPYWKEQKKKETMQLIKACTGLWFEATASDFTTVPGQSVKLTVSAINRSGTAVQLQSVKLLNSFDTTFNATLANNALFSYTKEIQVPLETPVSNPYWLSAPHSLGLFTVNNQLLIGKPESDPNLVAAWTFSIAGKTFSMNSPVRYKWTDPVKGELYRAVEVLPQVTINMHERVLVFTDMQPRKLKVTVKAFADQSKGVLRIAQVPSLKISPTEQNFSLDKKGDEAVYEFTISPAGNTTETATLHVTADIDTNTYTQSLTRIEYDHIPVQTWLREASVKVETINLKKKGKKIGYIAGAGDEVPEAIKQMGYEVVMLSDEKISNDTLSNYDAIITGVRTYNINERMKFHYPKLMQYVQNGGNLIVQYNTNNFISSVKADIGPYPFKVTRDRVTDETAEMRIVNPGHPVLNTPNKITAADFDGWVQERGLYFVSDIDPKYQTIFSCNDPGEKANEGSMIITQYGKGYFVYTGIAFFRELPAGVPGAYRLFANMISLGK